MISGIVDVLEVLHRVRFALVKARLVVAGHVGHVNLEPAETSFTERLRVREPKDAATHVVTDVRKVGRDRVGATAEVEVVREVELLVEELAKRARSVSAAPTTAETVHAQLVRSRACS